MSDYRDVEVCDITSRYTTNAPLTLCRVGTHDYISCETSADVPSELANESVAHIGSHAYGKNGLGIHLWVSPPQHVWNRLIERGIVVNDHATASASAPYQGER